MSETEKTIQAALYLLYDNERSGGVYRLGNYNVSREQFEHALRTYIADGKNTLEQLDQSFDANSSLGYA